MLNLLLLRPGVRPKLAPTPPHSGRARKIMQKAHKISPGEQFECHFVTSFWLIHKNGNMKCITERRQEYSCRYPETAICGLCHRSDHLETAKLRDLACQTPRALAHYLSLCALYLSPSLILDICLRLNLILDFYLFYFCLYFDYHYYYFSF